MRNRRCDVDRLGDDRPSRLSVMLRSILLIVTFLGGIQKYVPHIMACSSKTPLSSDLSVHIN
jgi:hypothetical protein